MNRRLLMLGVLIAGAIALPAAWYLISPLFVNKTVEEAFPTSPPEPAADFVPAEATAAMEQAMAEPTHVMQETMPAGDASTRSVVATGEFYDVVHEGKGRATIYRLADGSRVLRLEDFEVLNGPDLHVWLVQLDPVPDTIGVEISGYVDLGKLKGNAGSQNYDLPSSLDVMQFKSVVIWCEPFRVPFSAAPLRAP